MSFKISLKDTSFYISINSLRIYLSLEFLLNFLLNFFARSCVEKSFKSMVFTFVENALNLGIFSHAPPPPHSKLFPKLLSSDPRQREITHSPRQHFSENLFPSTTGRGRVNYDLLYQNLIRKYEDDLEH